ncbi:MAG: hypothetical protein J1E65_00305 [Lachnospiraceae bacterium]|nr:hypothetical protein [Lachnospiraceae bacterium]
MSDISIEKKLELIRSIREANSRNRNSLRQQQHILYGGKYDNSIFDMDDDMTDSTHPNSKRKASTLGIRALLAVILFSVYVILDYTGGEWLSLNSGKIFTYIGENYSSNAFAFIEKITYTLDGLVYTENEK